MSEDVTFKIGDDVHSVVLPKGKKGRKATNYLLSKFGLSEAEVGMESLLQLLNEKEFEDVHLPVILGVSKDYLEEEGTSMELIMAIMVVIQEMFETFNQEEVQAALGNSPETQGEDT